MKKIFVLIGPPSVGKSTWIQGTFAGTDPYIVNRDDLAEQVASSYGWTYDDMFVGPPTDAQIGDVDEKYGEVVKSPGWMTWQALSFSKILEANNRVEAEFTSRVAGAKGQDNIVVDMTNMNAPARKRALSIIQGSEGEYEKIAVVFEFEGAEDVIQKIALKRAETAKRMGKSKTVPPAAIQRMFAAFQKPSGDEGFDKVLSVDNREMLRNLASENVAESTLFSPGRWALLAGIKKKRQTLLEQVLLETEPTQPIKKKFHIPLPADLLAISKMFQTAGKQFYLVGGAVRDALMGKEPKDLDIATDAQPDDVVAILQQDPSLKILEIGKAFGVVKTITAEGNEYEIATFRRDIGVGRRPDAVAFTTIDQDVARRDLTINALFYDIETGEIVDYVGGMEDIEKGTIRTVGSPEERFGEDRLRVLRALRFAARIGSGLDPATAQAIKGNNSLVGVSAERIRDEFLKGIKSAKSVPMFYNLISEYDLWPQVFPGLNVSKDFRDTKNIPVALGVLLRENDSKILMAKLNNLKYSADEVAQVSFFPMFMALNVNNAFKMKKFFKNSRLGGQDLVEFSGLVGKPDDHLVNIFLRYEPSITGLELQSQGFSGKELGQEMERRETEIFRRLS